jgi:putative hydrolase of the HAD superfamily
VPRPAMLGVLMAVSVVGFDADDTLWHSESHFAVTEERFRALLQPWLPGDVVAERLLHRERTNLEIFGYGAKGFTLSMIETALEVSDGDLPAAAIQQLIDWGKALMSHPVELLDRVPETLDTLAGRYRLVLITKGDLFHQESKVAESGLSPLFERIEIVTEKSPDTYRRVLGRCGAHAGEFVMVGNSLRSDVLPVVEIGGRAVHVPYGITWAHEAVEPGTNDCDRWSQIPHIGDLPELLVSL